MNPHRVMSRPEHAKPGRDIGQPRLSALGCQLGPAYSLAEGAICAAGRSLPEMSLAFALMAAINSSTGSCATLSHGLYRTKPRRRQPGGRRILIPQG